MDLRPFAPQTFLFLHPVHLCSRIVPFYYPKMNMNIPVFFSLHLFTLVAFLFHFPPAFPQLLPHKFQNSLIRVRVKKVSALCALSVIVVLIVQSIIVSNTYSRYMYTQLYWLYLCSYSIGNKVQNTTGCPNLKDTLKNFKTIEILKKSFT